MSILSPGSNTYLPTPQQLAQIDFSDRSTNLATIWAVNITSVVLVSVIVSVRIYVRTGFKGSLFLDDSESGDIQACEGYT
jgi:hypothetical protein